MTRSRGLASRAAPYLFFLLLAPPAALAFDPNFDFYPKDSQSCLLDSAKGSKCTGDTAADLNSCLCGNGGNFVILSARCLGKKDKKDVGTVYDTMSDACATSQTPLTVEKDDFVDAADDAADDSSSTSTKTTATKTTATKTSSSTSATKTPNSTSSSASTSPSATTFPTASASASPESNENGDDSKKKLSTAGTIGIAAGVSVAGVAVIAALAFFLVRRRKRNGAADEAHPMLPQEKYGGGPTTYPPHDPSPSLGSNGFEHETKSHYSVSTFGGGAAPQQQQQRQSYAALSNASPDPQQHNFLSAWEPPTGTSYNSSPSNSQYVGPYAAPQGVAELPPQTHQVVAELPPQTRPVSNVFELDSHGVAAPLPPQQALQQPAPPTQQPPREYKPYVPR